MMKNFLVLKKDIEKINIEKKTQISILKYFLMKDIPTSGGAVLRSLVM